MMMGRHETKKKKHSLAAHHAVAPSVLLQQALVIVVLLLLLLTVVGVDAFPIRRGATTRPSSAAAASGRYLHYFYHRQHSGQASMRTYNNVYATTTSSSSSSDYLRATTLPTDGETTTSSKAMNSSSCSCIWERIRHYQPWRHWQRPRQQRRRRSWMIKQPFSPSRRSEVAAPYYSPSLPQRIVRTIQRITIIRSGMKEKKNRLIARPYINKDNAGNGHRHLLVKRQQQAPAAAPASLSLVLLPQLFLSTRRRVIVSSLFLVWASWTIVQSLLCRRRQRADATSEWGRYARDPGARGRAVMNLLCIKLLPLFILSKIAPFGRQKLVQKSGDIFADGLLKLGPLYIKLGQIASCRENLFPDQWKISMERLQDKVPARTGSRALELAYEVWPGGPSSFNSTFEQFDTTPLAAASLGQVHKAVLATNTTANEGDSDNSGDVVAVKLQRPFLREIYDQDLALLTKIAATVDRFSGANNNKAEDDENGKKKKRKRKKNVGDVGGISQSWVEIFEDAEEILYREIDYRQEATSGIRFCNDFGLGKGGSSNKGILQRPSSSSSSTGDDANSNMTAAKSRDGKVLPSAASWLRAPYVYDRLSNEKVLVMEYVPSIKITNSDKLDANNVTLEQREYLADALGRAYLRQFCCNLFFSTDPHPGNLGVEILDPNATKPENRVRLVFYDFGQVAFLSQTQADGILQIIEAIVDSDVDRSIVAFQQMGVLKENADLDKVRAKVADNYKTGKVKANRKRLAKRGYKFNKNRPKSTASNNNNNTSTTNTTTSKSSDTEVMQYFTLPAEYAFVGRALSQMDGVGKSLDSEFDFVSSAAPWMYEIKGATQYLKEEAIKWIEKNLVKNPKFKHLADAIMPHYVYESKDKTNKTATQYDATI